MSCDLPQPLQTAMASVVEITLVGVCTFVEHRLKRAITRAANQHTKHASGRWNRHLKKHLFSTKRVTNATTFGASRHPRPH